MTFIVAVLTGIGIAMFIGWVWDVLEDMTPSARRLRREEEARWKGHESDNPCCRCEGCKLENFIKSYKK